MTKCNSLIGMLAGSFSAIVLRPKSKGDFTMTTILFFAILVIIYLVFEQVKSSRNSNLKKMVGWCIVQDPRGIRRTHDLFYYILIAQKRLELSQEYCITTDVEEDLAERILADFQMDTAQKYFSDKLSIPESEYISEETFFMYLLQEYLYEDKISKIGSIYNNEMYEKRIVRTDEFPFDRYILNDYTVVVYKLYYISYMCCKNDCRLKTIGWYWEREAYIENIIQSKII